MLITNLQRHMNFLKVLASPLGCAAQKIPHMLLFDGLERLNFLCCGILVMVGTELFCGEHGVEMLLHNLVALLLAKFQV